MEYAPIDPISAFFIKCVLPVIGLLAVLSLIRLILPSGNSAKKEDASNSTSNNAPSMGPLSNDSIFVTQKALYSDRAHDGGPNYTDLSTYEERLKK